VVAARVDSANDAAERILQAALGAFSERGFDGARTRDIAARANVTLGLVQYHFGSKEKLWKAAVERAFGSLHEGLALVIANPHGEDERGVLRRLLRAHVSFVAENTQFIRIMHDEGKRRGPRMRWLVDRYVKPLHDRLTPLILRAQEQGVLPGGVAPAHFVYIMIGAVGMIFHQAEECKRVAGFDPVDPSAVASHGRAIEALFLGPSHEENR
jgi:TetR/AcrR family transcriptional regulator